MISGGRDAASGRCHRADIGSGTVVVGGSDALVVVVGYSHSGAERGQLRQDGQRPDPGSSHKVRTQQAVRREPSAPGTTGASLSGP
jgi:hypothetical protein